MVVINTKKIFITILVSALLLVGSALTVFAFDFSAPQTENSDSYELYYTYNNQYDDSTGLYNNRPVLLIVKSIPINSTIYGDFTVYVTDYGLELFTVNGFTINSMYNLIDVYLQSHAPTVCVGIYSNASPSAWVDDLYNQYVYATDNGYVWHIRQDLNNQFFNYEIQYNDILSRFNTLNTQHQDLISRYNALEQEYLTLETNYTNVVYENEILRNEAQEYERNLRLANNRITELNLQVNSLQIDLNNALVDVEALQQDIANYQTSISQLEGVISRLESELETSYMAGYTSAIDEINAFESGIYTIFSSPFVIVGELSQIELFGTSITKIVGIILLFIVLSIVLAFIWKIIPFV